MSLSVISTPAAANDAARWAALRARDARFDGSFYYAVRTTGVYCRPSCPSRLAQRSNVSFHETREAAERAGFRPCKRCRPQELAASFEAASAARDWERMRAELNDSGSALLKGLLSNAHCQQLARSYADADRFRSRVVMSRHGFGCGEYQYFSYPLPPLVARLRQACYAQLVPLANDWQERLGSATRYPRQHARFLARCRAAGQRLPTPLLLRYQAGDYNCLHQDVYGECVFPLQLAVLLSQPGTDFDGGEFVLAEQRPRRQSRVEVAPLRQGDAVVFAVRERPVRGARGTYRVQLRHGVSRVRHGERFTLGVIFHDAR